MIERAGVTAISKMFACGEAIISEERRAWQPITIGLSEGAHHKETADGKDIEAGRLGSSKVHPASDQEVKGGP